MIPPPTAGAFPPAPRRHDPDQPLQPSAVLAPGAAHSIGLPAGPPG